jgi:hypothetical protein
MHANVHRRAEAGPGGSTDTEAETETEKTVQAEAPPRLAEGTLEDGRPPTSGHRTLHSPDLTSAPGAGYGAIAASPAPPLGPAAQFLRAAAG